MCEWWILCTKQIQSEFEVYSYFGQIFSNRMSNNCCARNAAANGLAEKLLSAWNVQKCSFVRVKVTYTQIKPAATTFLLFPVKGITKATASLRHRLRSVCTFTRKMLHLIGNAEWCQQGRRGRSSHSAHLSPVCCWKENPSRRRSGSRQTVRKPPWLSFSNVPAWNSSLSVWGGCGVAYPSKSDVRLWRHSVTDPSLPSAYL